MSPSALRPFVAGLAVLCCLLARAAEGQDMMSLSLADAIARGLETSHRVGELAERQLGAAASERSARATTLPQVSALAGYTRTNHVTPYGFVQPTGRLVVLYPDVPDNFRSRVDVQYPLYTAGRLVALIDTARAEVDAASRDIEATRNDLRLDIARAYWALVTARQNVSVVEASVQRMDAHLSDARARYDAGLVPPNEVLSAEAQRSLEQALLIETQNNAQTANLLLARLVGLSPDTRIQPTEPLDSGTSALEEPGVLATDARRSRADRAAIEARLTAAGARQTAATAGSKPTIGVAGGFDYARPNPRIFPRAAEWNESWDVSVNATWLLFDGGRVRAEVAAAEAARRGLEQRLKEFDSVLETEVRQRYYSLQSERARVEAAEAAVRSATEARRVLSDRYAAGVATNTEVLDAQVRLLDAELNRARALAAVRIAQAGLDRAVGR